MIWRRAHSHAFVVRKCIRAIESENACVHYIYICALVDVETSEDVNDEELKVSTSRKSDDDSRLTSQRIPRLREHGKHSGQGAPNEFM